MSSGRNPSSTFTKGRSHSSYPKTGKPPSCSFTMVGEFDDATDNIGEVIDIVEQAREEPGFRVLITGQATVSQDFEEVAQDGLAKGEAFGVPIAVIILILVFGAVVAAIVPIILAVASIIVAFGAASLLGQAFGLIFFIENMIYMIGLAVGIDYSLFIVARYREERRRGLEKLSVIGRAGGTATRTVSFSGMAVVLGLIGMLLVPSNVFIAIGLGAIFVVIAAVFASMTLLPAILSLIPNPPKDTDGRREDSGRGWVRELQGRWPGVLG